MAFAPHDASPQVGLSATLDDEKLPRGRYELRARAVDRAGNERSTQTTGERRAGDAHAAAAGRHPAGRGQADAGSRA